MGRFTAVKFLNEQFSRVPPVLSANLAGRSVLVTGANTGLGLEAAKHFARMKPARLILACRNETKAQRAAALIAEATNYNSEIQIVDFANFNSVVDLSTRLGNDPIDILVANAGVAYPNYRATKDGWEETLQINHLSTALISFLLLPNLLRAAELHKSMSRLVIVSSEMSFLGGFDASVLAQSQVLSALSAETYCTPQTMAARYPLSKLLNVLFTRAFTQHLVPDAAATVVPTAVNPGYCASELHRSLPTVLRILSQPVELLLARTAEKGARQLVWAALGPDGKDGPHVRHAMAGAYVSLASVQEPSDFAISKEGYDVQERVWRETIDILAKEAPVVQKIIDQYLSK